MGLIPGQGGYLSIIDAFIMSGKISNANIAKCSDSYRRKGYTALVSQPSTQNLNLNQMSNANTNTDTYTNTKKTLIFR